MGRMLISDTDEEPLCAFVGAQSSPLLPRPSALLGPKNTALPSAAGTGDPAFTALLAHPTGPE